MEAFSVNPGEERHQYRALSPEVQSACHLFTPSALLPPLLQPAQDPSMAPNRCTCRPVTPGVAPPPAGRQGEGQLGSEHPENAQLGPLMGPILWELGSALQQVDDLKEVFLPVWASVYPFVYCTQRLEESSPDISLRVSIQPPFPLCSEVSALQATTSPSDSPSRSLLTGTPTPRTLWIQLSF